MASTKWHCIALVVLFSLAMCSAHKVKPLTSAIIANEGGRKIRILADITHENHHDDHELNHPTMAGGNDDGGEASLGSPSDGYSHKNNKCAGSHAGSGGGAIPGHEGNTPIGGGGYGYGSGSGDGTTGGGGGGGGGWSGNAPGYGGYPGSGGFGYGGGYGSGGDDPVYGGPGFPIPGMSGVDGSFNCLPSTCGGTPFTPCTGFTLLLTNHGPMMASTTTPSPSLMTPPTSPEAPQQMPPRDMSDAEHHHSELIMPSMAPGYA